MQSSGRDGDPERRASHQFGPGPRRRWNSRSCPLLPRSSELIKMQSTLRTSILGHVETAPPSGISTFRFLLDATKLEGNPEMGWFRDPPAARVVFSKAHPYHRIFACLCRSGELVNVVAHFPDKRVQDSKPHLCYLLSHISHVTPCRLEYACHACRTPR